MKWMPLVFGAVAILVILTINAAHVINSYIHPTRYVSEETPARFAMEYDDVEITTEDGVRLSAWYVPAPKKVDQAIVVLHGYPFDKGNMLEMTQFLHEDYNLLYVDFRAMGKSEGGFSSLGFHEQKDVRAAVQYLEGQDVGVFGISMGAAASLLALPEMDVKAVVADSSYASLEDMLLHTYGGGIIAQIVAFPVKLLAKVWPGIDINKVMPVKSVEKTNTPILLVHGSKDNQVPVEHSEMIVKAAKNAELWVVDTKHVDAHVAYNGDYEKKVLLFLRTHFKQ